MQVPCADLPASLSFATIETASGDDPRAAASFPADRALQVPGAYRREAREFAEAGLAALARWASAGGGAVSRRRALD
jgi:hypothetical protein